MNDDKDTIDEPLRPVAGRVKYRCKLCQGSGQIPGIRKTTNMGKGMGSMPGPCPECEGNGWIIPLDNEV